MATGAVISAPAVVLSVVMGLSVTTTCLLHGPADGVLHDVRRRAGGGLDRRQADGADRRRPAGRGRGAGAGPARRRGPRRRAAPGRHGRPPADLRLLASTSPVATPSGRAPSRAFFLFCSYFGTDQSQVQRYLTAKSVDEARTSLLMSAYWKIPLQALVLLIGVLMFVFYLFTPPPMLFNAAHEPAGAGERAGRRVRGASKRGSATAFAGAARGRRAACARDARRATRPSAASRGRVQRRPPPT